MKQVGKMKVWGTPTWGALVVAALMFAWEAQAFEASVVWRDEIVTEGIPYGLKKGYSHLAFATDIHDITLGVEYLQSLRENYNEVHLMVGYGWEMGAFAGSVGLARVDYSPGTADDTWEILADIEWGATEWLSLFVDGFVDVDDVEGGFFETGISLTPPDVCPFGVFSFEPYVLVGWDVGFVSGPRRVTENHWQFGLEMEAALTDHWSLVGDVQHARPLTNLDREGEGSVTWGGVGIAFAY